PHQDTNSHGTHVASTAAGNGRGTGAPGVAPNADLIIVKFDFDNECSRNSSIAIIEGVRYIFDASGEQPAAVNLSLGSDLGPHTGLTGEETGLSSLARPGKIAVFAAGNAARNDASGACSTDDDCGGVGVAGTPCGDGGLCACGEEGLCVNGVFGYPIHGEGELRQGETSVFTLDIPDGYEVYPGGQNYVVFDLWYGQGIDGAASVVIYPPGGRRPHSFGADDSK
ncbi:MAG: S8 family serine peptidase, partial [Actinobacteria bacterium]|nr:S8 family serine peptidase [Actinomycetota bacterium]NIU67104.1 S8 family serine peptidase [Actinomycetota bacterium]